MQPHISTLHPLIPTGNLERARQIDQRRMLFITSNEPPPPPPPDDFIPKPKDPVKRLVSSFIKSDAKQERIRQFIQGVMLDSGSSSSSSNGGGNSGGDGGSSQFNLGVLH